MNTETKIICTIGPASSSEMTLLGLAGAGMNVARLNMSHGNYGTHKNVIDKIHKINSEQDLRIKILMDLEGYRIRIGRLENPIKVEKDEKVMLSSVRCETDKKCIVFDYDGDLSLIPQNADLFIDDGHLRFKILEVEKDSLLLKTIAGGTIKSRKGINIPDLTLPNAFLNEQDEADIKFGVKNKVDFIAQSFVCNAQNIELVRKEMEQAGGNCGIFAKIENAAGVKNIDSIIDVCEGILVARGDLGISLPVYKVPVIQKHIITRCIRKKKHVIIATQMLERVLLHHSHDSVPETDNTAANSNPSRILYPYILMFILSIHSIIAGIALGIEDQAIQAIVILLAVLAHKGTAAFALGVSMLRNNTDKKKYRSMITFFSFMTPLGILLGYLFSVLLSGSSEQIFEAIFDALAAGTFIYVAVMDILDEEFTIRKKLITKFSFVLLGLAIMAVVAIWT